MHWGNIWRVTININAFANILLHSWTSNLDEGSWIYDHSYVWFINESGSILQSEKYYCFQGASETTIRYFICADGRFTHRNLFIICDSVCPAVSVLNYLVLVTDQFIYMDGVQACLTDLNLQIRIVTMAFIIDGCHFTTVLTHVAFKYSSFAIIHHRPLLMHIFYTMYSTNTHSIHILVDLPFLYLHWPWYCCLFHFGDNPRSSRTITWAIFVI